jgi:hypothetical protein
MKSDQNRSSNGVPKVPKPGLYVRSENGLKLRDRKVQKLVRSMRIAMPWIEDSDLPACRAWAQLEILADTTFAVLRQIFIINKEGEPRRLLTDFRQLRQTQLAYERELGMTPAARATIQANGTRAALDLAAALANTEDAEIVNSAK